MDPKNLRALWPRPMRWSVVTLNTPFPAMVSMISLIAVGQTVREYVQGLVGKIGSLVSRLSIPTDGDRSATYHFSIKLVPFPSYPTISVVTCKFFLLPCNKHPVERVTLGILQCCSKKVERRPATWCKSLILCTTVISTKYQHALDRQTGGQKWQIKIVLSAKCIVGRNARTYCKNGTTFAVSAMKSSFINVKDNSLLL